MRDGDEGFARNVMKIFGSSDLYEGMADKPLASVTLNDAKDRVTFAFADGSKAVFGVEGDCCSHSWIEYLTVPDDVAGAVLLSVDDSRMDSQEQEYGLLQVYNTKFRTVKGDIVLEYRNESNGYYGGYLVRVTE